MWSLWPNIRFLPSIVAEKNVTKNILEGRTDRGKTVYPPLGSKCVDLILIGLPKCWNNFFFFKILYTIILWKWQVYDYTVKMSSRNILFSPVQPNFFLQDSEFRNQIIFRKKTIILKLNSLRGKLIKKNCKTKMVLPYTNKKTK